jgi:protein-disulfide isomerase
LSRFHFFAGLLVLGLAVGCKAQPTPVQPADLALNRHIEVMVRTQFNVPPDYSVAISPRQPSQIPGYQTLPVALSRGAQKTVVDFLISNDGKTLARLETFDLAKDPAFNIDINNRPVRGNTAATVTVVNFDDLECPYCARMHETLFPSTLARYKDKVRFVYKDNPLAEIHPWAVHAAVDANCLAAQNGNAYWAYVDYLHSHGEEVNGSDRDPAKSFDALNRITRQQAMLAKLDLDKVEACIKAQDESAVRASMKEAESLRIDGAPAVFVDGERISGAVPDTSLWQVIDRALRAQGIEPPAARVQSPQPPPQPAAKSGN